MKSIFTCVFVFCISAMYGQSAPTNVVLLDQLQYSTGGNDVWGYVAPDDTEYALVGLRTGTSIVSLADPTNVVEVDFVPGANTTWRDLKTWNHHAYVSNESAGGVAIIDLVSLPDSVTYLEFQPMLNGAQLQTIHNLYIDEFGYLYVAGSNLNNGGIIIYDLNDDPNNPTLAGTAAAVYAHDVYTRDNMMYTSDIYDGVFRVHDVSDKSNITVLASQSTPFNFTHNAWLSDDSKTIFTTDETGNAYTGAYDISDLNDIKELDRFRPAATEGNGVIPHNVHVKDDFLVISHYTDGIIIVDANKPDIMVETGNYDTYDGPDGGFSGCWGAFPFFPSGIILASNLEGTLDVLMPDYVRACYLEGQVTDANTGAAISEASIEFTTVTANSNSDISGDYGLGYATAGTYDVTFSHPAYFPQTVSVSLANGEVTIQDIALMPKPTYSFTGQVVNAVTNVPIEGAVVYMESPSNTYNLTTDGSGNFSGTITGDTYEIYAGKWGFNTKLVSGQVVDSPVTSTIPLDEGIKDEFVLDLGWTVTGNAATGTWERADPIGTDFNGPVNPEFDLTTDLGDQCYTTGNGGGGAGDDDIDDGITVLTSPTMDLTMMNDPQISYHTWFVNAGGAQGSTPNDRLEVRLTDGNTTVIVQTIDQSVGVWQAQSISVKDHFPTVTSTMQIIFEAGDYGGGHLVEAGVDLLEVTDVVGVEDIDESIRLTAFPNPFTSELNLDYKLESIDDNTALEVRNALGQLVYRTNIAALQGTHTIRESLEAGIYFVQITNQSAISAPMKVVKQ